MSTITEAACIPTPVQDAFGQMLSIDQDPSSNWAVCDDNIYIDTNFNLPGYSAIGYGIWELNEWLIHHYPRAFSYAKLDDPTDPGGDALRHAFTFNPDLPVGVIQQCLWDGGLDLGLFEESGDSDEDCKPKLPEGVSCEAVLETLSSIRFLRYSCPTSSCTAYDHRLIVKEPIGCAECGSGPSRVTCDQCESPMEVSIVYDASHLPPFFYPLTSVTKRDFYGLLKDLYEKERLRSAGQEQEGASIFIDGDDLRTLSIALIKRRDVPLHIAREFLEALDLEFKRTKSLYASILD